MKFKTTDVNGIKIFYRESGDEQMPVMVLFHGFPSASHMFRDLMPMLEDKFHLIAPDYPGFAGNSKRKQSSVTAIIVWKDYWLDLLMENISHSFCFHKKQFKHFGFKSNR